jgi:hypothetical protein
MLFVSGCGGKTDKDKTTSDEKGFVYCPDFSQSLPLSASLPWGAVGYINNGCSAVQIDGNHVVAASHCVVNNGVWQAGLRYYPNYQTPANRPSPPRYRIARAVAGTFSRDGNTAPNAGFMASDWAILRLDCDTTPGGQRFCPPITSFPSMTMTYAYQGEAAYRGGYDRDATKLNPDAICPPYTDENDSCPGACPCDVTPPTDTHLWWQSGFVDPSCVVDSTTNYGATDYELRNSCSTRGGASGSPIVHDSIYGPQLVGIVHGSGAATPDDVPCQDAGPGQEYVTVGPGAERFIYAPRYAKNVGLTRAQDGTNRTQVLAVDSDDSLVRTRMRKSANLTDGWTMYSNLGSAVSGVDRIAATYLTNLKPEAVVNTTAGTLYLNYVDANGNWTGWTSFTAPGTVLDVSAAFNGSGLAYVYAVTTNLGGIYRRSRSSTSPYAAWGNWTSITTSFVDTYYRVSAIRRHGDLVQMAFLVTYSGAVKWMREPFPAAPSDFAAPAAMIDIDAGWTADNRAFVIAVDSGGGLWYRDQPSTSGNTWNAWSAFNRPMFLPDASCPGGNPTGLTSLNASRWQDNPTSTVVPVIFATDNRGMIYYTTYETGPCTTPGCDCGGAMWQPWKAFYHMKRWADY